MFTSSKPLSFTTFIDFFDDEGNKFSIPISGTTDNSVFTIFSFMQRNPDEIRLEAVRKDLEEFLFTRLPKGDIVRQAV